VGCARLPGCRHRGSQVDRRSQRPAGFADAGRAWRTARRQCAGAAAVCGQTCASEMGCKVFAHPRAAGLDRGRSPWMF